MLTLKKIRNFLLPGLFLFLFFAGCDKIEPPYMTDHTGHNGAGEVTRKVLLEEFTGHQCPNCPAGHQMAKELKTLYGERLVIVSIHAGWFARVSEPPFDYDFTSPAGDELNTHFGVELYPIGMVNRKSESGSPLIGPTAWAEVVSQIIDLDPDFHIELSLNYLPEERKLEVNADIHALTASPNQYSFSAFLTEDGIISPQKINDPDYPSGVIEDYEHNHVLRKGINGTWGETLNDIAIQTGDVFSRSYSVNLDTDWIAENCNVVAFVYDSTTREVVQVEKMALP